MLGIQESRADNHYVPNCPSQCFDAAYVILAKRRDAACGGRPLQG